MSMRKIIKGSLISLAVLGMVGGSMNSTIANARHRHIHYTRRIKRARHHGKRNRLYRHHGRIRYSYRRNHHARRHYVKKYRRIRNHKHVTVHRHHTKRSKADATHKYIVDTNVEGGQLLGGDPRDAASAFPGGSDDGTLVKIDKKAVLDGHTFYKISSKSDIDANGWIYAGDLSNRPNGKGHPFNWNKNEPKIEKWENQQNDNSDVSNDNNNTSDNSNNSNTPVTNYTNSVNNSSKDQAISSEEINLINQDRANHGQAPLQESSALDQIAQIRAKQSYNNTSSDAHIDPNTGQSYYLEDAKQLGDNGLFHAVSGENLAKGATTAKGFNKLLYTNEESYDGGHYRNIIGQGDVPSQYNQVGVGTYKDSIAEDFMGPVNWNSYLV